MNLRYPNITGHTTAEQVNQLRGYLYQLVEELNLFLLTASASGGGKTYDVQGEEISFFELKSLIVSATEELASKIDSKLSGIKDLVSEAGSLEGWTYRKWESGTAEIFGSIAVTLASDGVARGSMFTSGAIELQLPFALSDAVVCGSCAGGYIITSADVSDTAISFELLSPETFSANTSVNIGLYITGTIKKESDTDGN